MNTATIERRIEFQGCSNFRDLGGYRTKNGGQLRWGRLFRSDGIHNMTRSDAEKARRDIGIATVVDLRTAEERKLVGIGSGPAIASVVKLLARADTYPAVFHCMAGKDRTGVLAATLLSILGVSDEDIVNDYVLTDQYCNPPGTSQGINPNHETPVRCLPQQLLRSR